MQNCSDINKRSYNLDALRVLSMFFIVLGHFWHGGKPTNSFGLFIFSLFSSFSVIGTNLFFLLSGYFQGKKEGKTSISKVLSIWGKIMFYSWIILISLWAFAGIRPNTGLVIRSFFPLVTIRYWFMTVYVFIYILSPYINRLLHSLSKTEFLYLLLIFFIVFSIFPSFLSKEMAFNPLFNTSCIWGLVMYCIGVFLMRFEEDILPSEKVCLGIYLLLTFIIFLIDWQLPVIFQYWGINSSIPSKLSHCYYSPLLLFDAVICFGIFRHLKIQTSFFSRIAPYMLGIYLIHDNNQLRDFIWKKWLHTPAYLDSCYLPVYVLLCAIIVFVLCLIIESFRFNLTAIINRKLFFSRRKAREK